MEGFRNINSSLKIDSKEFPANFRVGKLSLKLGYIMAQPKS